MIVSFKHNGVEYSQWDISIPEMRQKLESKGIDLVPIAKTEIQKKLLQLQKQRLQNILDQYGYNGLADVQFYASQNDHEAQTLLNWYSTYDNLLWSYIDNDLAAFTSVDELLQIDMKNIEQQIYEQSIQASPLP
ncbi:hypothetical protein [Persephonella sp.]